MNTPVVISLCLAGVTLFGINLFFDIKLFEGTLAFFLKVLNDVTDRIGGYNLNKYVQRVKKERIIREKENVITKYNRLVEQIILDFELPLTLESFTSLLTILFIVIVLIVILFMGNVPLSFMITVAIFISILTLFTMQSKAIKNEMTEHIMDAEDIISPLARDGVLVAIKKATLGGDYIHDSIKPYFLQFIDNCENNGYSFKQAITILNRQLGRKFDNFTKKAITFEYNERKGMADVFLDIIDENAVLREMNAKKDIIFAKMNRDFILKTVIIILFFMYALTIPDFKQFMINTNIGKVINTVIISTICISFARCQTLQINLETGGAK